MSNTGIYGFDEDPGFDMFRDVEFSSRPPQQINDSRSVTRPRSSQDDINPTPTKLGRTSALNTVSMSDEDDVLGKRPRDDSNTNRSRRRRSSRVELAAASAPARTTGPAAA